MGFWDDLSNMFKKGVSVVAQKTDEYTKLGKIKVEIIGIKRDIDRNHTELGAKVYNLMVLENNARVSANDEVKEIIDKVKALNEKLALKKEELERVRQEYADKTGKPVESVDVEIPVEEEAKG